MLWGAKISGVPVDKAKEVEVLRELELLGRAGAGGGGGTVGNKAAILSVGGNPGTLISGKMVLRLKLL